MDKLAVSWKFRPARVPDELSFQNFSIFTALTLFFVPVDSLKSFHIRVCCFLMASLCRAWLIAFGGVNSGSS